jgi:putative ABC transport system permease protein
VAYAVTGRRSEIGIRLALGANRVDVIAMLTRQAMTPVLLGVAGGIVQGLLMAEVSRSLLFGVEPTDPKIISGVAALLCSIGLAACLIPARRATKGSTLEVLRSE